MPNAIDPFWSLSAGVLAVLLAATAIGRLIALKVGPTNATVINLNQRINAWWTLVLVGLPVLAFGKFAAVLLFAGLSFLALREFMAITPTRQGDQAALRLAFFAALPAQYVLVAIDWYGLFSILLPVYGFFALSVAATLGQDTDHFLERNAKIQWAVMVCIYGISHAPALLFLNLPGYDNTTSVLLLFFLLVTQISDVMQYVFGKLFGKRKLAPLLSPSKTWEGLIGGGLAATAIGAGLHGFTPFSLAQAVAMSAVIVGGGFFGGLILSAVKRSLGAKDWGASIQGHGGILDRLDSVAFSAPLFFHLTRYFFTP
jgi:phosphatidate cytidylyltransferase